MERENLQHFHKNDIVYYINKSQGQAKWRVWFGVIDDIFTNGISIELYDTKETRLINGIPYENFETPTHWKKLPKGWSYDTRLFDLSWEPLPNIDAKIDNVDNIRQLIMRGIIVPVKSRDYSTPYAEIDVRSGWRVIRQYHEKSKISYICLYPNEVYLSYQDAQAVVDAHNAELERQSRLSDLEWSIEQIDRELSRAWNLSDNYKQHVKEFLLSQSNVENIEVRWSSRGIEWKYVDKRRWLTIPE